jgi:hypothetical protein
LNRERLVPLLRYAAAFGENPAQNLLAKWEQLFRRFAPPNLGQRHFPLYEASLLSMRTVELPSIYLLVLAVLSSCGKFDVSSALPAQLRASRQPRGRGVLLPISPETQIARSHRDAA